MFSYGSFSKLVQVTELVMGGALLDYRGGGSQCSYKHPQMRKRERPKMRSGCCGTGPWAAGPVVQRCGLRHRGGDPRNVGGF